MPVSDDQLRAYAARAAHGELDAAEDLIRAVHPYLFSQLVLHRIPANDVEDVAQTVVLEMYRALREYDPQRPFLPWLHGLVANTTSSFWRKRERTERKHGGFSEWLARRLNQGSMDLQVVDRLDRLKHCIERLPARQQQIVQLHYYDALASEEIGHKMGQSGPAIRQALNRIRIALRACVGVSSAS